MWLTFCTVIAEGPSVFGNTDRRRFVVMVRAMIVRVPAFSSLQAQPLGQIMKVNAVPKFFD